MTWYDAVIKLWSIQYRMFLSIEALTQKMLLGLSLISSNGVLRSFQSWHTHSLHFNRGASHHMWHFSYYTLIALRRCCNFTEISLIGCVWHVTSIITAHKEASSLFMASQLGMMTVKHLSYELQEIAGFFLYIIPRSELPIVTGTWIIITK